ncbi:MAG TPA: DUF1343 domain-containing protein [Bacteroidales bacterium]|jgi:uncharacterized protein YbbC (DUF1343 family)|nr:DUF1343 domain-containing protein [Bacteroidales bacterium]|tara:strand:+ start:483 stop:1676 length:1194 start_codon:yes stop_codon:yes gene_type:complete
MNIKSITIIFLLFLWTSLLICQTNKIVLVEYDEINSGASQIEKYLPFLLNNKIAIVANQSTLVGNTHLIDTLLSHGVNVTKIFCPEHGFRGVAEAGKKILDSIDLKTKIPIISLYGSHKKPSSADLENIDLVLFDLQDVGTRFYTYISTLTYVMEACAENKIPIIVLDRPNPNGYFIDGPVLEKEHQSFIGLHPVPVVYGMTIGEYARMVAGECWINKASDIDLSVIPLVGWDRNMIVKLKMKPSPNLPNWQSVYLYSSLCFLEGTIMSIGRGTDFPFQVYGHPEFMIGSFIFTPDSTQSASHPKFKGVPCYGANLRGYADNYKHNPQQINLSWLIGTYETMRKDNNFFTNYFEKLAGTDELRKQIVAGLSEDEIRKSWQPKIDNFKKVRAKYLLYP